MKRYSGLQKQVLGLYRDSIRAARKLPSSSRVPAILFVRGEFRTNATQVEKLDVQRIEFLIRQGKKKITQLSGADVSAFGFAANGAVFAEGGAQPDGALSAATIAGLTKVGSPGDEGT
jgi:succinate dehydrogenase assembly factor 1